MPGWVMEEKQPMEATNRVFAHKVRQNSSAGPLLQRKCACGQHTSGGGECAECKKKRLQRRAGDGVDPGYVPGVVHDVLRSPGHPLDQQARAVIEPHFGQDFSRVRVHTDAKAADSARSVNALAYTVGQNVVFGAGQYAPGTAAGQRLLAHELTHVVQQKFGTASGSSLIRINDSPIDEAGAESAAQAVVAGHPVMDTHSVNTSLQRRAAPYIKKVSVHLEPPQSADLEWQGSPPSDATGEDHFTVSTGKGYGDPGDPPGTCTRSCCSDAMTQCAPPWNQPGRVGACCTFHGDTYWTGTPVEEHNGWKWWTPIQPYYSRRGIALHQHHEVTGQPIGHGCVRMDEPNAKRIYDYSNGRRTQVAIDGRAAPVACDEDRQCEPSGGSRSGGSRTELGQENPEVMLAMQEEAIPGLEGVLS
jgi:hypothetical protein